VTDRLFKIIAVLSSIYRQKPPYSVPCCAILRVKRRISMSTSAQIRANRENAQHSTGPKTEEGKAASSHNNFRHGFTGAFTVLPFEDQSAYDQLFESLHAEHQPLTITETILVEKMAQSHWLAKRAQRLQELIMGDENLGSKEKDRRFALFLRYQTTNDRAFTRALHDLLKLRAERRKTEIGFESQKRAQAQEQRREAAEQRKEDEAARRARAEERKKELHKHAVSLAEMKVFYQEALTDAVETDKVIAQSLHQHETESKKAA
jgi:hypothetical protein